MLKLQIGKVAILGAGVMGAQMAALFANAGLQTLLFDLKAKEGEPNALANHALSMLKELQPSPLADESVVKTIQVANYEHDIEYLIECDLIIEAISERLDWKQALYQKIGPYITPTTIIATNTSGLSLKDLAQSLPHTNRANFCGVHFFNPPRYMTLVELTAHPSTDLEMLANLEAFLVSKLGKGVVHARDTPNFIGNRIGVFAILSVLHHAKAYNLTPDTVDLITGPIIGRAKSATFRTLDIVGLDTFIHVVNTMKVDLPDDPWHAIFEVPDFIHDLVNKGALGQKTKAGIYKKIKNEIQIIDVKTKQYRPIHTQIQDELLTILKIKEPQEKLLNLRNSTLPAAKFLWAILQDLFHYCAYHLSSIANNVRDVDLAMRWGYDWQEGPFELWQKSGWQTVANWVLEGRKEKKTFATVDLPSWVFEIGAQGVYGTNIAYNPLEKTFVKRLELPVYKRQLFPERILGETYTEGKTIFENDGMRLWTLDNEIAILSFKTKKNIINVHVLDGILEAIARAEIDYKGLVLWQCHGTDFSFGADLKELLEIIKHRNHNLLQKAVSQFQRVSMALRYARIPTVAAIRGLALGGSCEFLMHCSRVVSALEAYPGLVEVGAGIIPAGAGTKEMARRASINNIRGIDPFQTLQNYFKSIAMAEISTSALHAKRLGFLRESDLIMMNPYEILYFAKKTALALYETNYLPPLKQKILAVGKNAIATLQVGMVNLREGGFISDHDYLIGCELAKVLCGGNVEGGVEVDEQWFLELEQEAFLHLIHTKKTQERIQYVLEHGKPLRN